MEGVYCGFTSMYCDGNKHLHKNLLFYSSLFHIVIQSSFWLVKRCWLMVWSSACNLNKQVYVYVHLMSSLPNKKQIMKTWSYREKRSYSEGFFVLFVVRRCWSMSQSIYRKEENLLSGFSITSQAVGFFCLLGRRTKKKTIYSCYNMNDEQGTSLFHGDSTALNITRNAKKHSLINRTLYF